MKIERRNEGRNKNTETEKEEGDEANNCSKNPMKDLYLDIYK